MVRGNGQMVYWKGGNVTVYGQGGIPIKKLIGMPNGQGRVPFGIRLYIIDGKVKEG